MFGADSTQKQEHNPKCIGQVSELIKSFVFYF